MKPLKEFPLTSGNLSFGPGGLGPHRRDRGRAVWYLQHGDFSPTIVDGASMDEIKLPYAPSPTYTL